MRELAAYIVLGMVAVSVLTGCASMPAPQPQCLPLKSYSIAEQHALAQALAALPAASPLRPAFADYAAMRDGDRACLAQTH